nr:hypothetical protein [uncultured Flavobacterium sp.]
MKKEKIETMFSSMENFSSTPPPELWDAIEKELDTPKKKKRVVAWWFAAASLLVGIGIPAYLFFQTQSNPLSNGVGTDSNSKVVYKENPSPENPSSEKAPAKSPTTILSTKSGKENHNVVVVVSNPATESQSASAQPNNIGSKSNQYSQKNDAQKTAKGVGQSNNEESYSPFATLQQKIKNNSVIPQTAGNSPAIAATENQSQSKADIIFNASSKNEKIWNTIANDVKNNSISNSVSQKITDKNTTIAVVSTDAKVKEQWQIQQELAVLEQKAKGEEPESKDKKDKKQEALSKWSMQVVAGVNTSQNYSNQQTLGVKGEAQQGKTYGVTTQYKLNKKWSVGSGLKLNELGQQLKGVSYYNNQMVQGAGINGVIVAEKTDVNAISTNSDYIFLAQTKSLAFNPMAFSSGDISQNLKYVELPLTVSYVLFQKSKTNIHLNTGGFVGKLVSNQFFLNGKSIGANNQVNDMVYGTLLSSTVQYKVFPTTHLFVEPGMNLFSSPLKEQSFNQFQWSLNFGVHFDF